MLSQDLDCSDGGSFSMHFERLSDRTLHHGPLTRLRARARAPALDRALIAGVDPSDSPQLAARAAQLTSRSTRAQIAEGLERLLTLAQGPPRRFSPVSSGGPALANAARLHELAALLRRDTPIYARAIAILNELLTDGSGPAYHGTVAQLAGELHEARLAAAGG